MKRILLISIAFPPKNDPESLQAIKYIKYLAKNNSVDVVTSKSPTLWMPYDEKLLSFIKDVKQMLVIPIFEPKYASIFINKLLRRFMWPDTRMTFWIQYKKVIKELNEKPEIIYSRAFPLSSIFMAKKLKEHYNIPWVLHLSDPWVESPLFNYNKSKYHQKKEQSCFKSADIISFTSLSTIDIYKKKYPEFTHKYKYFQNVYDDEDIQIENKKQDNNKTKLVYTGSLNGSRSLKLLIDSILIATKKKLNILENIEIVIAGSLDSYNKKMIEKYPEIFNYVGFLSIIEVKELQRSADILLAVDFNFKSSNEAIFFPSKLLDYFVTKKPILAITIEGSTTDQILTKHNHFCVYHDKPNQLVELLFDLDKIKSKTYQIPLEYSAKTNVKRLIDLFEKL